MRMIITKKHSTKAERRFAEILKSRHIPFNHRVKINGRECDFLIGKYVVEVDSHDQDSLKNRMLVEEGYTPLHFNNKEIKTFEEWVKKIWQ